MKKCANCGKENIDEAIYCANCGSRLESISNNSASKSSSTPTPALDSLKNHIGNDSSSRSSSGLNSSQSNDNQPSKWKICCCYVPIVLFVILLIFSLILNAYPENFSSSYGGDFKYLDSNGDGKLTFEEARQLDPYMKDSEIKPYFLEADKNSNGYLIGYEFDGFRSDVRSSDSSSYSSSSSSSSPSHSYSSSSSSSSSHSQSSSSSSRSYDDYDSSSEGYVLTCPYCGSEAIYETGGYYKCAECGSSIYNPDDLELGYQEGYMELLAPVSLIIN